MPPVLAAHVVAEPVVLRAAVRRPTAHPDALGIQRGDFRIQRGIPLEFAQVQIHGDLREGGLIAPVQQEGIAFAAFVHAGGVVVVMPGCAGDGPVHVDGGAVVAGGLVLARGAESVLQRGHQRGTHALPPLVLPNHHHGQIAGGVFVVFLVEECRLARAVDKTDQFAVFFSGEGVRAGLKEAPFKDRFVQRGEDHFPVGDTLVKQRRGGGNVLPCQGFQRPTHEKSPPD